MSSFKSRESGRSSSRRSCREAALIAEAPLLLSAVPVPPGDPVRRCQHAGRSWSPSHPAYGVPGHFQLASASALQTNRPQAAEPALAVVELDIYTNPAFLPSDPPQALPLDDDHVTAQLTARARATRATSNRHSKPHSGASCVRDKTSSKGAAPTKPRSQTPGQYSSKFGPAASVTAQSATPAHSTASASLRTPRATPRVPPAPPPAPAAPPPALAPSPYRLPLWPTAPPAPDGPQPLHWHVDRPSAPRRGLADWHGLARSADVLAARVLSDPPPPEPRIDILPPPPPDWSELDGDDPAEWRCIGQPLPSNCTWLDLNRYGPMLNGLARGRPRIDSTADLYVPFALHRTLRIGYSSVSRAVRFLEPVQVSLKLLLDGGMFSLIARATNAFARGRGASDPLLADWRDTDCSEAFRFFLADLVTACITSCREDVTDEQLMQNPLLARLMGPRRFLQMTRAFRLKRDDQTPEEFVTELSRVVTLRTPALLKKTVWVYSLETYPFGPGRAGAGQPAGPDAATAARPAGVEMCITVLRVGRCVFRLAVHTRPEDTHMSGNRPTPSPKLLERLMADLPLKYRHVVAVGGATVPMAEFFHSRGAWFVGSVGPQVYRLVSPRQEKLPMPEEPYMGVYLEPSPGLREVILLRSYSRDDQREVWIGYPVPRGSYAQTHLICNIGVGQHTRYRTGGPGAGGRDVLVPQVLGTLERYVSEDELLASHVIPYVAREPRPRAPHRAPPVWHQSLLMYLLFVQFTNGWHAHAHATCRSLKSSFAMTDVMHHLFGFMYDWVTCRHCLWAELSLAPDTELLEAVRNAVPSRPRGELSRSVHQTNYQKLTGKVPAMKPSIRWTSDRVSEWRELLWNYTPLTSAVNEWHGSTVLERGGSARPHCSEDPWPRVKVWPAIFARHNYKWGSRVPLAASCAIGLHVRSYTEHRLSRPSTEQELYWGRVKMAPATSTHRDGAAGDEPWRAAQRAARRRSL